MGLLGNIGLSVLKPRIWQLEVAQMALNASPEDILSIPKTAVQEFTGIADDLQNFLFKRALNLSPNDRAETIWTEPPPPSEESI